VYDFRKGWELKQKPLVLYHANCWDGFCAAWVLRRELGDIEARPAQYGQNPPDVTGRQVYVVDFSYPRAQMIRMHDAADSLVVIDHHKTAEEELAGLDFCTFDMDHSGGRLTWDLLCSSGPNDPPRPWLVDYTEDRDLWLHKLPDSEAINAALRSFPLDFELWDSFADVSPSTMAIPGFAILRRENQIKNARPVEFDGHAGLCVNATVLFSSIAGRLAAGRPFGACWFMRSDGKRQWSLRSDDAGVDVAEIAKARGGGGHVHASGFEEEFNV
jgi:uncharacterized protein